MQPQYPYTTLFRSPRPARPPGSPRATARTRARSAQTASSIDGRWSATARTRPAGSLRATVGHPVRARRRTTSTPSPAGPSGRGWVPRLPAEFDGARRLRGVGAGGEGGRLRELRGFPGLEQGGQKRLVAFDKSRLSGRVAVVPQPEHQLLAVGG